MDLKQEMKSEAESAKEPSNSPSTSKQLKSCSDCRTTRTPLWRGGPDGPKSLCNACGIKYNKKRRAPLGLDTGPGPGRRKEKGRKKRKSSQNSSQTLRVGLMALSGEMMLRRSGNLLGELKEEEQAAILLMSLSCSSVYA